MLSPNASGRLAHPPESKHLLRACQTWWVIESLRRFFIYFICCSHVSLSEATCWSWAVSVPSRFHSASWSMLLACGLNASRQIFIPCDATGSQITPTESKRFRTSRVQSLKNSAALQPLQGLLIILILFTGRLVAFLCLSFMFLGTASVSWPLTILIHLAVFWLLTIQHFSSPTQYLRASSAVKLSQAKKLAARTTCTVLALAKATNNYWIQSKIKRKSWRSRFIAPPRIDALTNNKSSGTVPQPSPVSSELLWTKDAVNFRRRNKSCKPRKRDETSTVLSWNITMRRMHWKEVVPRLLIALWTSEEKNLWDLLITDRMWSIQWNLVNKVNANNTSPVSNVCDHSRSWGADWFAPVKN